MLFCYPPRRLCLSCHVALSLLLAAVSGALLAASLALVSGDNKVTELVSAFHFQASQPSPLPPLNVDKMNSNILRPGPPAAYQALPPPAYPHRAIMYASSASRLTRWISSRRCRPAVTHRARLPDHPCGRLLGLAAIPSFPPGRPSGYRARHPLRAPAALADRVLVRGGWHVQPGLPPAAVPRRPQPAPGTPEPVSAIVIAEQPLQPSAELSRSFIL